eukprot:scaffold952_cov409-Prasinococcus_capsulatus_cf.AAC.48
MRGFTGSPVSIPQSGKGGASRPCGSSYNLLHGQVRTAAAPRGSQRARGDPAAGRPFAAPAQQPPRDPRETRRR